MYKIERRQVGYLLTFSGVIDAAEMQRWYEDSERTLVGERSGNFGVIIDMRQLQPVRDDAKKIMVDGQRLYKVKGMKKSAVILSNTELCTQFKNLAVQSGIYATERYIDVSKAPNAVDKAIDWVKDGKDPDIH